MYKNLARHCSPRFSLCENSLNPCHLFFQHAVEIQLITRLRPVFSLKYNCSRGRLYPFNRSPCFSICQSPIPSRIHISSALKENKISHKLWQDKKRIYDELYFPKNTMRPPAVDFYVRLVRALVFCSYWMARCGSIVL